MELEPDGGNVYKPHAFQISSGRFWRCKHGRTGFAEGMKWVGCDECAKEDPEAFAEWNKTTPNVGVQARPQAVAWNELLDVMGAVLVRRRP